LITCKSCGKENQDHYKFCLGCGGKLEPAGAAGTPGPVAASPMEIAKTVLPPAPMSTSATAAGELQAESNKIAPKPKGGIPWGDSPKMPPVMAPFNLPPNPLAGNSTGGPRVPTSPTGTPALEALAPGPAAAAPAAGGSTCPTCGKAVQPGFAFCGSCGTRMAKAPSGAAAALGVQKTMYGSGMAPTPAPVAAPRGRLVLIRPDGTEGGTHPLHDGETLIGRGQGTLFEADAYLSPRHAEFTATASGLVVRDLRSLNGVFLKITGDEALESGDIFRLGQELLRFEVISPPQPLEDGTEIMGTPNPGFWGRLSVIVGRDVDGSAFPLFGDAIVLGRERGDILFPEDGYVSGTHARISLTDGQVSLSDLGSSNGTFLRLRHERTIPSGSFILMGQQLFRVEFR
jgi:pSer/pThr/pTyr-binding forkhead associated (FHA) protein